MELSDPRLADNLQRTIYRLVQICITMFFGPSLIPVINHVPIYVANVVSLLIAAFGTGLLFALASQRVGKRHKNLNGLIETLGWGFLVLMPAMIFWVTGTPSLMYGSRYWNYLWYVWYYGYLAISVWWVDFFVLHRSVSRRMVRAIPRSWTSWAKPDVPRYIQACFLTLNRLP